MGEEDDPQRLKRIAAAAYDYENDPRWAGYWSNILIPPHMASRSDVVDNFKRKFYRRYIDPDYVVEAMVSSSSSQSQRPAPSPSSIPNGQAEPRNSGSTTRTSRSTTAAPNPSSLVFGQQKVHFVANAWVLMVAVFAIIPLMPTSLSNRAYQLSFMGTVFSSVYSLYSLHGKPRAWNLQAVQLWFQSVMGTKEFIYFIYCLNFATSHLYLRFALIPILSRALENVAKFLRRNFSHSSLYRKYLEETCVWVESNTTTLNILSSHAEIGLGFLLILSLFSRQRNIIQTFMYWQLLKLMYNVPVTAGYHQSVWTKIGRTVNPLVHRYAPFLSKPISAVQSWWVR